MTPPENRTNSKGNRSGLYMYRYKDKKVTYHTCPKLSNQGIEVPVSKEENKILRI